MAEKSVFFNYIITIHNKQELIERVMMSVINCAGEYSHIYPVLDGCTDRTESIIDQIIVSNPSVSITKLFAGDVHELKSINIGLNSSSQEGYGFNIILQDDVVLTDSAMETHCVALYQKFKNLGIVSFRHGQNISRSVYQKNKRRNFYYGYIENEAGHGLNQFSLLKTGYFTFKEVVMKSPICIPFEVVKAVGIPDDRYAPWDDLAYCYTVVQAGFYNGVYAIEFQSDLEWGTTREKVQKKSVLDVQLHNIERFREDRPELAAFDSSIFNNKKYLIFDAGKRYPINFSTLITNVKSILIDGLKNFIKSN